MELKDLLLFDKKNHQYYIMGDDLIKIPSVTQLLKHVRIIGDYNIPKHYAERGTEVHEMSELVDARTFNWSMCSEVAKPYVRGYFMFRQDNKIVENTSEEMVFHNELFYAGTLDRRWNLLGQDTITDLKTGNRSGWHSLQLGAYHAAKKVSREVSISNVYINPDSYEIKVWTKDELDYALEGIKHIAWCYWASHKRDYAKLEKLSLELCSQPAAKDDFFFN